MKRISLLALALSTTATMAGSEDYFEGGILWTTFAPQTANEIAVPKDLKVYRSGESTLNDENNGYSGNDRDRINAVEPLLIRKHEKGLDGELLNHHTTVDRQIVYDYGVWIEGSHKYKRELTTSLAYAPEKDNFIRFEEPIEIYADQGKINKLPLPYDKVANQIIAKAILVSDSDKSMLVEIKQSEKLFDKLYDSDDAVQKIKCDLQLIANGKTATIKVRGDVNSAIFGAKKGKNTLEITQSCELRNYISSYRKSDRSRVGGNDGDKYVGGKMLSSMDGFAFRVGDIYNSNPVTKIKNRIKVKNQQPLDIHYSDEEKADPVLWTWEGLHYSKFSGFDEEQLDKSDELVLMPKPVPADLTNVELIRQEGQDYHLGQFSHGVKNMYKGTFFPKTTGIYEILVAKKTNLKLDYKNDKGRPLAVGYVYPNYSLAMDYSRPVAHSLHRTLNTGKKPIEYDWFWFEVDDDDVKYGMDMSLHIHANLGLSYTSRAGYQKLMYNDFMRSAEDLYDNLSLLDKSTDEHIPMAQAGRLGLKASQQIGFYIKPARAAKFRKFQQSDFAKIDGSTSKHGHDIDGSSEGRINGANKLDLSDDQALKGDMQLLGGFD